MRYGHREKWKKRYKKRNTTSKSRKNKNAWKKEDNPDDITLLANTPAQAESLLHRVERAASGIGLHVNADKAKFMCFNKKDDISTQKGSLWN